MCAGEDQTVPTTPASWPAGQPQWMLCGGQPICWVVVRRGSTFFFSSWPSELRMKCLGALVNGPSKAPGCDLGEKVVGQTGVEDCVHAAAWCWVGSSASSSL